MLRAHVYLIISLFLLGACAKKETSNTATNGRISPTYAGPAEAAYCAATVPYGGSTITVSGTAQYVRRETYNQPSAMPSFTGLGSASTSHPDLPAGAYPIRAAEVRVTDAAGNVVQCAQTDPVSGAFSFTVPAGNITYKIAINSRSAQFNGGAIYMNASVLNKPEANQFYSLVTTISAGGGNVATGVLQATALTSGPMLGAAFNILDMFFNANAFLRNKVGTCGATFPGCTSVTTSAPVPKVSAYWEKGFNPNDYFGSTSGLSFYLPDYSRLFILGGISGEIDDADTDHFDNSVILHEYGHFLEDSMFFSDSPGGSHNGNKVIDPRLAWSEGWGNFIQAAILSDTSIFTTPPMAGTPRYFDSSGNVDGTPDLFFAVNLEDMTGTDLVTGGQGEGNFREFSVSRMLIDAVDGTGAEATGSAYIDNISGAFNQIWAGLTKTTGKAFRQPALAFRNIGDLHLAQQALGTTSWSAIRAGNYHDGNTSEYGEYVTTAGSCAIVSPGYNYEIDPTVAATNYANSNLFLDNDFYHLKIATAGTYTISLDYKDADGTGQEADLELYLYNESAQFAVGADILSRSMSDPDSNPATPQNETITVALAPGNYLINVNAFTAGAFSAAGPTQYSIKLNGANLCPASL